MTLQLILRQFLGQALLKLEGHSVFANLKKIRELEGLSRQELQHHQLQRLERLLMHSAATVPFYAQRLREAGVVKDGNCDLRQFSVLPLLNKDDIRASANRLITTKPSRGRYSNTSGGSTGVPVSFVQDRNYDDWNIANKLYFNQLHGKRFGEPEIKLWGSDRDILQGTLGLREKVINGIYNRRFLNTFDMSQDKIHSFVATINAFKPVAIWGYYDSTFELARFINSQGISVHSPRVVITTIGKLSTDMRAEIKRAFNCPVIDQYGSREVGAIGIERTENGPLSLFPWTHYIEVVDESGQPTTGEGRILVTTLENFSMPLIRYEIGDLGVLSESESEFPFFQLSEVTGRTFSHFVKSDGSLVHAQFFVTLTFSKPWIKKFQFVQHDIDDIELLYEPHGDAVSQDIIDITNNVKKVMGPHCKLSVKQTIINPSDSGKFIYTVCKVREAR